MFQTTTIAIASLLTLASPGLAASEAAPRDPATPGCVVLLMTADHVQREVSWTVSCDEGRYVTIDATAFQGTADDHEIVEVQNAHQYLPAGSEWSGTVQFDAEAIDMIRAQAVTFVSPGDPHERPAIIGGATG
ncbi:hypothetical protein KXS11_09730 [Plantibacter flavus]|uniref:hypothetical protein n=1 Tax=Plantibacter flavus TaxID=150123 RepID=UPI003F141055